MLASRPFRTTASQPCEQRAARPRSRCPCSQAERTSKSRLSGPARTLSRRPRPGHRRARSSDPRSAARTAARSAAPPCGRGGGLPAIAPIRASEKQADRRAPIRRTCRATHSPFAVAQQTCVPTADRARQPHETPAFPEHEHEGRNNHLEASSQHHSTGFASTQERVGAGACGRMGRGSSRRLGSRLGLAVALQPVVGNRLPRSCVGDEGAPARPDAGIAVERAHPHAHLRVIVGVAAKEVRTALAAEQLLVTAIGMTPRLQLLLASQQSQGAPVDPRLRRA